VLLGGYLGDTWAILGRYLSDTCVMLVLIHRWCVGGVDFGDFS
jgi:hypothetical protein